MRHLGVFEIVGKRPPVVVLQYPGLDTGKQVLVAPLYEAHKAKPISVITPQVALNETEYLIGTHLMASISVAHLQSEIGSLTAYEYDISRALSRLFFGN